MNSCNLSIFDAKSNTYLSLPSTHLAASVTIIDVNARVCLSQTFLNKPTGDLKPEEGAEAIYTFPLPPTAAVCAFEAVWDDGSSTVGTVLPKEDAKAAYETAQKAGQQAGLVEQLRDDIFSMRVGNIPSGGKTVIKLTYVIELADDGNLEHIRFNLPTSIAPKYSSHPSHSHTDIYTNVTSGDQAFSFEADIEMTETIQSVSSPSHNISVSPVDNRKMKIKLTADVKMDKDLVLVIQAKGLDAPRAVVESWEAETNKADDVFVQRASGLQKTKAVGLTLVPRFTPSPLPAQEYIFLLDRSGSMQGFKNASLRSAMQLILRSLPPPSVSKTYIQIISFGSNASALYHNGSVTYDAEALQSAGEHCKTIEANYGGTEMGAALEFALKGRRKDVPTSLFVLTDGETWDLDACLDKIRTAKTSDTSPLRVFSLGIGNEVDHLLVNSLARVGDGVSMFVGENERLDGKVMRLLRAARGSTVLIKDVQWGKAGVVAERISLKPESESTDDFEIVEKDASKPKSIFDTNHEEEPLEANTAKSLAKDTKPVYLPAMPSIIVAPDDFRPLYPGVRTTIYALISGEQATTFSGDISITAKSELDGEIKLSVPVVESTLSGLTATEAPLVHFLAARKLLEVWSAKSDAIKSSSSSMENDEAKDILMAQSVRLAMRYNLSSSHTSFVAIKESKEGEKLVPPTRASRQAEMSRQLAQSGTMPSPGGQSRMMMSRAMPMPAPMSATYGAPPGAPPPLMGVAFGLRSKAAAAPSAFPPHQAFGGPPPTLRGGGPLDFALQRGATEANGQSSITKRSTQEKLDALIEQQGFDGSFSSLTEVKRILELQADVGNDPGSSLFATILALTGIDSKNDNGVYTAVLEKGWAWVDANGAPTDVADLKRQAQALLGKGL